MNLLGMFAIGLGVGLLIGMTGMGSGSLLTPLLILLGGLSPATAVGTSLAFSLGSKIFGGWSFYRRGFVRMDIIRDLSIGGIPGVLVGAVLIRYLGMHKPQFENVFFSRAIGLVLIAVSLIMIARLLPSRLLHIRLREPIPIADAHRRALTIAVGAAVGFSVTITSIGSGAALAPAMVLFYRLDSGTLVGTNIFMGAILAAFALMAHAGQGHVNWIAAAALITGSVPALWFSTKIHDGVPRHISEGIIAGVLMILGLEIMAF